MLLPFVDNFRASPSIRANFPRHEFFLDLFLFPPFCLFWNRFFAEDSRGCGAKIQCNFFKGQNPQLQVLPFHHLQVSSTFSGVPDLETIPGAE